ncbi:MAG: hypothetical protein QNJ12_13550 [Ilumatobacter sp.]|uniref:hypothetical protein n=1 Tax=Ilumatobacter sp. TaxID=1967498 RepID=UPI00262932DE|nr:hypothetical protein [Ilumatobacter sp.]MDJ0769821.1 hypothetical protein [Ilumatobacter sp.]
MDRRLVPVNAFIALAARGPSSWPSPFADAGYRLEGLEIPLHTQNGLVVVDAVAFNPALNRFIAAECKSGNNIENEQAVRYGMLDPAELVRSTGVTITQPGDIEVQPCYVCLADTADRVELGLSKASCPYPIVVVGDQDITLRNSDALPEIIGIAESGLAVPGPPPATIRVDDESPDEDYDRVVGAAVMAHVARGDPMVSTIDLAGDAVPHLPIYGAGHRRAIQKRVEQAAQRVCDRSPENFEYRGRTSVRDHGLVTIVDSPERSDPRGRTQRYQAIAGRLGGQVLPSRAEFEQPGLFDDVDLDAELAKLESTNTAEAGEEEDE